MRLLYDGRQFSADGSADVLARIEWTPDGPGLQVYAQDRPMSVGRLYDAAGEIQDAFRALGYEIENVPPLRPSPPAVDGQA